MVILEKRAFDMAVDQLELNTAWFQYVNDALQASLFFGHERKSLSAYFTRFSGL